MSTAQKPLRIGILLRNRHDGPGGLEKVLEIVARAMPEKNVELYFYGLYFPSYDLFTKNFENITYLNLPKSFQILKKFFPTKLSRVFDKIYIKLNGYKLFDRIKADNLNILITMDLSKQFLGNYQLLKNYKEQTGIPVLSWIHSSLSGNSDKIKAKVKDKVSLFDGHLAISLGMKQELVEYGATDIVMVYNPVDRAAIVKRDRYKLIYIGRIDANKRVIELIVHLGQLKGEWTLDIYGSTGSKKGDIAFLKQISVLNMVEHVNFHGWKDSPWEMIDEAGVLLLNSEKEAFGLVVVEAMQRGIPVLAASSQGPNELIEHGVNGWLYPVYDEIAGIRILNDILAGDIQLPNIFDVIDSVSKYNTSNYVENFIEKIQLFLRKN